MEELIDIVDEEDNVLKPTIRSTIRKEALLHRVSEVIVISKNGLFLVLKRSPNKDIFPSCWEIGCAETVASGESYESAAIRGLKEELGINLSLKDISQGLQFEHKYRSGIHNVNCRVYKLLLVDPIKLQDNEIEEARFLKAGNIMELMGKEIFRPPSAEIFKRYMKYRFF